MSETVFRKRAWQMAVRAIDGVGRRTVGKGFDDLMAAGCHVIHRFDVADCAFLTFDDGPHPETTPTLLDALEREGVKATFFCIGNNARRWPALVRSIVDAGHVVGNHSMTHADLYSAGIGAVREELAACQKVLEAICGPVGLFRAPYGHFRWDLRFARAHGLTHLIKWDVAPPWHETNAQRMADHILADIKGGSIILLHDGLAHGDKRLSAAAGKAAAECVRLIAPVIRSRGLEFKSISSLFAPSDCELDRHDLL